MLHTARGAWTPRAGLCSLGVAPSRSVRIVGSLTILLVAGHAQASQLLVPAIGTPDSAMAGATVADPRTPSAAAFSNPAGLVHLEAGTVSFSIGVPVGHSAVRASQPAGYRSDSDFVAYAPEAGAVFGREGGLRWGVAMYGSLGAVFDSDADPNVGVTSDFLSESGISNLTAMVAWNLTERLAIGFALSAVYGETHLRYTTLIPFAYTTRGPGVQAMGGLRYALGERTALGLGIRTPGKVWARGDHRLPSGDKQDVDLDLDLPPQVFLGLNSDLGERWSVGLVARWTGSRSFRESIYRFEDTPQADVPFLAGASDEWRFGAGAEYALTDRWTLRTGFSWADAIVPDTWVSPLLVDSDEWLLGGGVSCKVGAWILDFTAGHSFTGERDVSPSEAAIFPGRYSMSGQIWMLGLRHTM
jgi:long-subunit fatty acid transport protein